MAEPVALPRVPAIPAPETVAQRVRRLQAEARALARDHVRALVQQLAAAAATATEISEGGDAYPAGLRDLAERLAAELEARAQTLTALNERA